ncbi:hypothetical protein RRG08_059940 [Elysia crispata]|uniref:Uncharacterized protein n=1 Tax=Elysia crispata TaxID=231223 RepID=A0AAE0Y6R2_9GAST|nr:hypothetical protein RRG08_059940 [Elysia crispata]
MKRRLLQIPPPFLVAWDLKSGEQRSGVSSGRVEHPGARDRASHDVAETRLLRRSWPSPSWSHCHGRRRMLVS